MFTGALAVIFLFPLIWTAVSSVSPHAGTSQVDGWGFGNYATLAHYQAGIWRYLANSRSSPADRAAHAAISLLGGYAFARFRFPGQNVLFLLDARDPDGAVRDAADPAVRAAQRRSACRNSLVGVALVLTMFQLPFSTFMMRISFESVPRELDEAAHGRRLLVVRGAVAGAAARR